MSTTIRVSDATKARIDHLAEVTGLQIQRIVDRAVADLERTLFFDQTNRRFAELRGSAIEWDEIEQERKALSASLRDRLTPGD